MRQMIWWGGALALVLALTGCGGAGSSTETSLGGTSTTGSAVRVNLAWGARTRDGLNSALSCVISIADPTTPSTVAYHWTENRTTDLADIGE